MTNVHAITIEQRALCAVCGKSLDLSKRGRVPKYCSHYHRQLAYQQRKARIAIATDLRRFDSEKFRANLRARRNLENAILAALYEHGVVTRPLSDRPVLRLVRPDATT